SRVGRFEDLLVGRAETVTNQLESRTKAAGDALHARLEELGQSIKTNSAEAERSIGQIASSATEAMRSSAGEVERTLLDVSAEVTRGFVGKADEIANSVTQRTNEMTAVLSDKSGGVVAAITEKGEQFAKDVGTATDAAVKSIETKGFTFTRTMLDNSDEISRMINSAGEAASNTVNRTLNELQGTAQKAIELSKSTATATVSEMLETHNMLRADTTALFERLREANIMLQEVLSGSHENMSALENTLVLRVSEFVTAMTDINAATGDATSRVESNIADFRDITARVIGDLGQLAVQFEAHGRGLASAAELIDRSNQRTEDTINERRVSLDSLVATLDIRTEDIDERLKRFSGLLDESLESASARAREIARTVETMRTVYEQSTGDTHEIFRDASERFAEIVQGMKQMTAEMQRELEATRAELRRGILELPQETSESAAQMRRVIVDQIEALAELNRIVARHGRNLDTVEPTRRAVREEQTLAVASGRSDFTANRPAARDAASFAPPSARRLETPTLSPAQGNTPSNTQGNNRGWLTDLLNRASRDEDESGNEPARETNRA